MERKTYHPDVLNVIRVIATLIVFLLHSRSHIKGIADTQSPLWFLTKLPAWAGVWIFVFISGYLLMSGFIKGRYKIENSEGRVSLVGFLKFYLGRFLRIAPIYYLYFIAMEFFNGKFFLWNNPKTALKILTFTFNGEGGIAGTGHLWYVSLAMQLYLVMPFIYLFLRRIKKASTLWILFFLFLIAGLAVRLILYKSSVKWYDRVYTFAPVNLDLVICASLLSFIKLRRKESQKKRKVLPSVLLNLHFIVLIFFTAFLYFKGDKGDKTLMFVYRYIMPSVYILSVSSLILRYHEKKKDVKKSFNILRFFDWFAPYSFAFYILHIGTFYYFDSSFATISGFSSLDVFPRYLIFIAVTFVLTLLGAVILTSAVEGISARLKGRKAAG